MQQTVKLSLAPEGSIFETCEDLVSKIHGSYSKDEVGIMFTPAIHIMGKIF